MKKVIAGFVATLALAAMIVPATTRAKDIKTVNASEANGKITISGTAEAGTLAVAIMVYDKAGSELMAMETAAVSNENLYYSEITLAEDTYLIKVADYDGGNYQVKTVSPATNKELPAAPNSGAAK